MGKIDLQNYDLGYALEINRAIKDIVAEDCRLCNEDFSVLKSWFQQIGAAAAEDDTISVFWLRTKADCAVDFLKDAEHLSEEQSENLKSLINGIVMAGCKNVMRAIAGKAGLLEE